MSEANPLEQHSPEKQREQKHNPQRHNRRQQWMGKWSQHRLHAPHRHRPMASTGHTAWRGGYDVARLLLLLVSPGHQKGLLLLRPR